MPAQPRPTDGDAITIDNLLIGMPYVEFTPTIGGVQQQPINLGVVDSAELAKELEAVALESSQSGTRVTLRELITRIDPEFNIGIFNFAAEVLRFTLGSATLVEVTADAASAITAEDHTLTADPQDYLGLSNSLLNAGSVRVDPSAVLDEAVGTGDGLLGDVSGDFTLDFKVRLVADVTRVDLVTAAGVVTSFTPIAAGAAASGNEVEVVVGRAGTSGDLQFHVGGTPTPVPTGSRIEADYHPSFGLVQGYSISADIQSARADDGGAFTDETADANSTAAADVVLSPATPATGDAFYVGMTDQYDRIVYDISTGQVGGTVVWEYFNGSAYVALDGVVDDTVGLTLTGRLQVTWDVPDDWVADTIDGAGPFYHVRLRETAGATSGAVADKIDVDSSEEYVVDLKNGRLQVEHEATKAAGTDKVIAGQEVDVTYTFNRLAHTLLAPFSQNVFSGTARIRQLTEVGINLIWPVPSAQIQVTDDALTFADDDFTVGSVTLKLLSVGGANPFGELQVFDENQAGA